MSHTELVLLLHYEQLSVYCFTEQVVELINWIPVTLTKATGMELEKLSWLGPFLGLSVFAEDNVSINNKLKVIT